MKIMINWMDHCGNNARFIIADVELPKPLPLEAPVYERRGTIHRYDQDIFSHFFSSDGQPCNGFGGATFAGTFKDGTGFEYQGAWSSRSSFVNSLWPEALLVDVDVGHMAVHMSAQAVIDWWKANDTDWGLCWHVSPNGEAHLMPTRNGAIKGGAYPNHRVEHLAK